MTHTSNKMPPATVHLDEIMPRGLCKRPALMSDRRRGVYLAQANSDTVLYSTRGLKTLVRKLNESRRAHTLLLPTHAYRVCWGKHAHHKLVVFRHASKADFEAIRPSLDLIEV